MNLPELPASRYPKTSDTSTTRFLFMVVLGLGKTHLLQALGNEIVSKYPEKEGKIYNFRTLYKRAC